MAYEPELETGEKLLGRIVVKVSKKVEAFCFAVTDRALYWPAKKLIAVNDPYYFRQIPLNRVQKVAIRRLSPYLLWVSSALMIAAGGITTFCMLDPIAHNLPGRQRVSGWPFALVVGGILLPFASKGRVGLCVETSEKSFNWKPPLVVDKASKDKIAEALNQISNACQQAGLQVIDERQSL